jgi:hypothetical protein
MRQIPSDKYTIAWFKLADCVSKGEREKAFGVYRLLAHSIDDYAYALKLEGDLLFAFNDGSAFEKYEQAAVLYQQHKRFKEAAALYEDLIFAVHQHNYVKKLTDLYTQQQLSSEFAQEKCTKLFNFLIDTHAIEPAEYVLTALESFGDTQILVDAYQKLVFVIAQKPHSCKQGMPVCLEKLLLLLTHDEQTHVVQNFLALLEQYNQSMFLEAVAYLNTK